jgi:glutaredoxin
MECRECNEVREFFAKHNIDFEELDIQRSPKALQELVDRTGSATHVPVIIVGDETFIDFDDEIAARILQIFEVDST